MIYKCNICNGSGTEWTIIEVMVNGKAINEKTPIICSKCNGFGKLNWIENIFGKKDKYFHNEWEERY